MTTKEWDEIVEADRVARARFAALPLSEQFDFLKKIGIYDANGLLSASYGGPGEHTREDPDAPIPTTAAP